MPLTWKHKETDPLNVAGAAMATAKAGAWRKLDPQSFVRQVRMFQVVSLQAAAMTSAPVLLGMLNEKTYRGDDVRNAAGSAIARTLMLMAPPGPAMVKQSIITVDAMPAIPDIWNPGKDDVGELGTLAVVVIAVAAAAAAAYTAQVIGEAWHAVTFEEEQTKQMLGSQATAITVIEKHIEREKIAGQLIPWDDSEKKLLGQLQDIQTEIVHKKREPLPTPFDGAREFVNSAANAATTTISSALPMAAVAAVALAFSSGTRTERN